jgi:hypothetical protein
MSEQCALFFVRKGVDHVRTSRANRLIQAHLRDVRTLVRLPGSIFSALSLSTLNDELATDMHVSHPFPFPGDRSHFRERGSISNTSQRASHTARASGVRSLPARVQVDAQTNNGAFGKSDIEGKAAMGSGE